MERADSRGSLVRDLREWSIPGYSVLIEYSAGVLDAIRTAALDGYHGAPHGGVETGGILLGTHQNHTVRITAALPIACEFAHGPSFVLSPREELALADKLKQCCGDPERAELEPVGWYRSHNRSDILLSDTDLGFFNRFFPHDWQVGLIVRPASFAPTRAGFFFREPGGTIRREGSYGEFVLEPFRAPAHTDAQRPVAEPAAGIELPLARGPELLPPESRISTGLVPRITAVPGHFRPRHQWRGYAAAATVLIAAAAVGYWPHKPDAGLALSVMDTSGQLRIVWDRTAQAIQQATRGSLEILDRGASTHVMLTSLDLRSGSVCYARQSGNVELRLMVNRPGKPPVVETTHFLKPGDTGAAPLPQPAGEQLPVAEIPVTPAPAAQLASSRPHAVQHDSSKSRAAKSYTARARPWKSRVTRSHVLKSRTVKRPVPKSHLGYADRAEP